MPQTKILVYLLAALSALILLVVPTNATELKSYTNSEIANHNKETDCWMSFTGSVYDLTNYISQHDKYLEIGPWCGKDMTNDFQDKAGMDIDHKASSYSLLELYKIGTLLDSPVIQTTVVATNSTTSVHPEAEDEEYSVEVEGDVMKTLSIKQIATLWEIDSQKLLEQIVATYKFKNPYTVETILGDMRAEYKFSPSQIKDIAEGIKTNNNPNLEIVNLENTSTTATRSSDYYNFFPIFISTATLYLVSYLIARTKWGTIHIKMINFNFFWNSILVICLIPSVVFGFYMTLKFIFPSLTQVNFDFLYWHVEGSIIFGTVGAAHIIQRLKQYLLPIKLHK